MGIKDDWEFALPFAAGRLFSIPAEYELRWVKIVMASMSVVAVLGILEYLFVPLELRMLWVGMTQAATQFSAMGYSGERIGSTLAGPAEFGNLCALALILWVAYRSRLDRKWLGAVGLLAIGLFLSLTRSAWIAAAIGSIFFEFRSGSKVRVLVMASACVALFLALLPTLGLKQFYSYTASGEDPSLEGHIRSVEKYVNVTIEHPLGTGPGTVGPRALERDPTAVDIESSYLTISVQYGILSGILFVLFCFLCLKGCLDNPSRLGLAAASMLLGYLLMLAIMPGHQSLPTAALVLFPVGAALNKKSWHGSRFGPIAAEKTS